MAAIKENLQRDECTDFMLSGKAVDLLQCIMAGLDDIVLRIARGIAEERQRACASTKPLRVEASDVEQASKYVFAQILSQQDLPAPVKADLEVMQECLTEKCKALR
jgi:hypothetical protein